MASYAPATVAAIAAVLAIDTALTPREVARLLPYDFNLNTVRHILLLLVRAGQASAEGCVLQKRYRRAVPVRDE